MMKGPTYVQFKHSGIVLDLPAEEVSPDNWTSGSNIQFQDNATRRVGGYAQFAGTLSGATGPLFAMSVDSGAITYWIYCTSANVYVTDGTTHFDITPTVPQTGVLPGRWSGCILNGIPVINSGYGPPLFWDLNTANKCSTLTGWPTGATCKTIRAFKYHLFALNVTSSSVNYQATLWWSKSALPGTIPAEWTPSATNDAGDLDLGDTPGAIVDGLAMRDNFMVYKEFATYALSYVAGQFIYTSRKIFLTSGVVALNCITEVDGAHFVFTGTDIIRTDGQNFTSLVDLKVKNYLTNSIDPAQIDQCCIVYRQRNNQIWVCVPIQGGSGLTRAFVINTLNGSIGIRNLPGVSHVSRGVVIVGATTTSWDSDSQAWFRDITYWNQQAYDPSDDGVLMCDTAAKKLWAVDVSDTDNGALVSAFIERASLPIGDHVLHALVTRVVPRLEGTSGDVIYIRTGGQAFFDQPISWSSPVPFVIGTDVAVNVLTEGRLISVNFSADTSRQWKIHSYRLGYVDLGLY